MSYLGKTRDWVYQAKVKGRFQTLHRRVGLPLLAFLFLVPWIRVGGHPAILIDLPARRLYALGAIFTPRDTIFLVLMLLFAAFSLFLFTSLFGRLWCGYACPQTVFLEELVRPIEEKIEGNRGQRMALDKAPWTASKVGKKALKWSLFLALAGILSAAILSWFADPRLLWTGEAPAGAYAALAFFAAAFYADFAWFREQFCNYLCPYARFQGALTDEQSQVVAYDVGRGEPRGKPRARAQAASTQVAALNAGSCIDCGKCVAVCPQGIDIRQGFQLECINCARCVDACAGVMGKLGETSLISYTTVAQTQGQERRILRPRTAAYGALLAGIAAAFFGLLATHSRIDATVNRAPGTLYVVEADGYIRNTFLAQIENNDGSSEGKAAFEVQVEGLPGAEVILPPVALAAGESAKVPLVVRAPAGSATARTIPIRIRIRAGDEEILVETTFKSDARLDGAAEQGA